MPLRTAVVDRPKGLTLGKNLTVLVVLYSLFFMVDIVGSMLGRSFMSFFLINVVYFVFLFLSSFLAPGLARPSATRSSQKPTILTSLGRHHCISSHYFLCPCTNLYIVSVIVQQAFIKTSGPACGCPQAVPMLVPICMLRQRSNPVNSR